MVYFYSHKDWLTLTLRFSVPFFPINMKCNGNLCKNMATTTIQDTYGKGDNSAAWNREIVLFVSITHIPEFKLA